MDMKVKNKNTRAYTMLHCPPDSPLGSKRERKEKKIIQDKVLGYREKTAAKKIVYQYWQTTVNGTYLIMADNIHISN